MSDIAKKRAAALNSQIFRQTERHCHLFGRAATRASDESWKREEAMRFIRHAVAVWQINEGLARLAALNAAHAEVRL